MRQRFQYGCLFSYLRRKKERKKERKYLETCLNKFLSRLISFCKCIVTDK